MRCSRYDHRGISFGMRIVDRLIAGGTSSSIMLCWFFYTLHTSLTLYAFKDTDTIPAKLDEL
jgi:hypothetical protein